MADDLVGDDEHLDDAIGAAGGERAHLLDLRRRAAVDDEAEARPAVGDLAGDEVLEVVKDRPVHTTLKVTSGSSRGAVTARLQQLDAGVVVGGGLELARGGLGIVEVRLQVALEDLGAEVPVEAAHVAARRPRRGGPGAARR